MIRAKKHVLSSYSYSNLSFTGRLQKATQKWVVFFLYIFLIGIIRKTWFAYAFYRAFYRDKNLHNFDKIYKIEYSRRELV